MSKVISGNGSTDFGQEAVTSFFIIELVVLNLTSLVILAQGMLYTSINFVYT